MNNRVAWIDIAKGIGIILVVVAHVLLQSPSDWAEPLARTIFLFHMPLFFVLAGMTLRIEPLKSFARRKALSLLLPYLIYLALLGIPAIAATCTLSIPFPVLGIDRCTILPIKLVLGGSMLGGVFGTFWFIPCLFAALCLAQTVLHLGRRRQFQILPLLAFLATALPHFVPWSTAILALGIAPMATILVLCGYWLRHTGLWLSASVFLLSLPLSLLTILAQVPVDMKMGQYGIPILSMIGALSLVILLLRSCERVAHWSPGAAFFSTFGQASLTILYLHQGVHLGLRQFGLHDDAVLVVLSLAIPLLFNSILDQLLEASKSALSQQISRKSSIT